MHNSELYRVVEKLRISCEKHVNVCAQLGHNQAITHNHQNATEPSPQTPHNQFHTRMTALSTHGNTVGDDLCTQSTWPIKTTYLYKEERILV